MMRMREGVRRQLWRGKLTTGAAAMGSGTQSKQQQIISCDAHPVHSAPPPPRAAALIPCAPRDTRADC